MRYVLEHKVGGGDVIGIWDNALGRGRLVWLDGRVYDLVRPRDDTYIDRIIANGESSKGKATGEPLPAAQLERETQLSLFGG